jgi:hypothetical protein
VSEAAAPGFQLHLWLGERREVCKPLLLAGGAQASWYKTCGELIHTFYWNVFQIHIEMPQPFEYNSTYSKLLRIKNTIKQKQPHKQLHDSPQD